MEDQFVHDRWRELGFHNLLPEEKDYIMIWWLRAEVLNGGLHQYFSNESGDHALQALDGLKKCGAMEEARLLQEGMDLLQPYGGYTRDWDVRNDRLNQLSAQLEDPFRQVDYAFSYPKEPMLNLALKRVKDAYKRESIDFKENSG